VESGTGVLWAVSKLRFGYVAHRKRMKFNVELGAFKAFLAN